MSSGEGRPRTYIAIERAENGYVVSRDRYGPESAETYVCLNEADAIVVIERMLEKFFEGAE